MLCEAESKGCPPFLVKHIKQTHIQHARVNVLVAVAGDRSSDVSCSRPHLPLPGLRESISQHTCNSFLAHWLLNPASKIKPAGETCLSNYHLNLSFNAKLETYYISLKGALGYFCLRGSSLCLCGTSHCT